MGGRGSKSGGLGGNISEEQKRKMDRLVKRNEEYDNFSKPTFRRDKDGNIEYEYTDTKIVNKVHGGKMQSPDKNDIYKRVTIESGRIMKDGLVKKNKSVKTETLIKKGKR